MKAKTMRYALGVVSVLIASVAGAQNNYALGPVESQNSKTDVVVLGQRFAIDSATRCSYGGKVVSKQSCTALLSRYAYAVVEGDSKILGRAAVITVFPFSYVSGASTVMVGARVTAVSPEIGVVRLGGLVVDNTSLLASGPLSLTVGAYLEIAGTQPASQGVLLADGLRFSTSTITGTGIQIQTITGTGIQTITGTGIQTITGTGIRTITGTGLHTITGTGLRTITGTGAAVDTITGTGSSVKTITGTGATVDTITGSGLQ